jgi:hypothetical protein
LGPGKEATMLTLEDFTAWMDRYAQASEAGDARAAATLFAPDAEYRETPFDAPIVGQDAIYRYWAEAAPHFKDVRFAYEILAVTGDRGIALWRSDFVSVKSGSRGSLDGVFLVEFDAAGTCRTFREWWHRQTVA